MKKDILSNSNIASKLYLKKCDEADRKKLAKKFDSKFYEKLNDILTYNVQNIFFNDVSKFGGNTESKYSKILLGLGAGDYINKGYTMGCCYFYALILAKALKDCKLVRGELRSLECFAPDDTDEKFVHSWVEMKDENGNEVVIDTTAKRIFNKEYYYKSFDALPYEIFDHSQLLDERTFFELGVYSTRYHPELADLLFPMVYKSYKTHEKEFDSIAKEQLKDFPEALENIENNKKEYFAGEILER